MQAINENFDYESCKKILMKAKGLLFVTKEHSELIEYTQMKKKHFEIDQQISKTLN